MAKTNTKEAAGFIRTEIRSTHCSTISDIYQAISRAKKIYKPLKEYIITVKKDIKNPALFVITLNGEQVDGMTEFIKVFTE